MAEVEMVEVEEERKRRVDVTLFKSRATRERVNTIVAAGNTHIHTTQRLCPTVSNTRRTKISSYIYADKGFDANNGFVLW